MLLRSALPSQKNKHFSFTTAYVFSSPFHGSESCLKREGECGWSYNFFMVHFALLSSPKSLPKARLNRDITTQTHSHTCSILYTCTYRGVPTAMRACYSFFKLLFRGWQCWSVCQMWIQLHLMFVGPNISAIIRLFAITFSACIQEGNDQRLGCAPYSKIYLSIYIKDTYQILFYQGDHQNKM